MRPNPLKRQKKISTFLQVIFLVFFFFSNAPLLRADTPPTDLTDLSIQEILQLSIKRKAEPENNTPKSITDRLKISYQYVRVQFEDYLDGSNEKTNEQILDQFDVVPTRIIQEAHLTKITYDALDNLFFSFLIPYIKQQSDHISKVTGFEQFTIDSSGIGDLSLLASYPLENIGRHNFMLHGGMSFPTGSIDEKGDTPSPGRNNQLPYTMQLGSGTYDLLLGGNYAARSGIYSWGGEVMQKFRLGRNSRDYSLGDVLQISACFKVKPRPWIEPSITFRSTFWKKIDGIDSDLPSPRLVPVATPEFFGGSKVNALFGLKLLAPEGIFKGQSLNMEGGLPVYQYLNGPHPKETWRIHVGWNWNF